MNFFNGVEGRVTMQYSGGVKDPFTEPYHADWQLKTKESSEHDAESVREVLALVDFGEIVIEIRDIEELDRGERPSYKNKNFLATVVLESGVERTVLCKSSTAMSQEELEAALSVMGHLGEDGVRVPKCLAFTDGNKIDGAEWRVFEFIGDERFHEGEEALEEVAGELANMHKSLTTYDGPLQAPRVISQYGSLNPKTWREFLEEYSDTGAGALIGEHARFLSSKLDQVNLGINELHEKGLITEQVIHGDVHPQNVAFDDGEFTGVLDFDEMKIGSVGIDVGMACHRLVRQHCMEQEGDLEETVPEAVDTFVGAYTEENPEFGELIPYLFHFMREYVMRKMSSVFIGFAEGRRVESDALSEIEKFISMLYEIDYMETLCSKG